MNNKALGSVGGKPIERINALTLAYSSQEYFDYYKRGKPDKKIDISEVSYFLLMRSLELALKALLKVKEGISSAELKGTFKHNVSKLSSYCDNKHYLTPLSEEVKIAVNELNIYYQDKDFEYRKVGYKHLPSLQYLITAIESVHKDINQIFKTTGITKFI